MSCMTIFLYKQMQISRSDIRPHIKWAVSLVILHMVTSIFLQGLCGYIWVNILTLSPRRGERNLILLPLKYQTDSIHDCKPTIVFLHWHAFPQSQMIKLNLPD